MQSSMKPVRGAGRPAKICLFDRDDHRDNQQWPVTTPDDKTAEARGLTRGFLTPERQLSPSDEQQHTPGAKRSAESADLATLGCDLSKRRQVALPASAVMTAMPPAHQGTSGRSCSTCGTRTTPKWRGPCGNVCNACGLAERKSKKPKKAPIASPRAPAKPRGRGAASPPPAVASFSFPVALAYLSAPGDPPPPRYASPRASASPADGNSKPPSATRPSPVGSLRGNPFHEHLAPGRLARLRNATPEAEVSPRASYGEDLGRDEPKRNPFYTLGQLPPQANLSGDDIPDYDGSDLLMSTDEIEIALCFPDNLGVAAARNRPQALLAPHPGAIQPSLFSGAMPREPLVRHLGHLGEWSDLFSSALPSAEATFALGNGRRAGKKRMNLEEQSIAADAVARHLAQHQQQRRENEEARRAPKRKREAISDTPPQLAVRQPAPHVTPSAYGLRSAWHAAFPPLVSSPSAGASSSSEAACLVAAPWAPFAFAHLGAPAAAPDTWHTLSEGIAE